MIDRHRAGPLAALLTSSAIAIAACGGGTTATATPTTEGGGEASAPVAEATPSATPTPATEPGTESGAPFPSFDLDALSGAIPGVDSYRTSVSVGGEVVYQSVVVTQPELSKAVTIFDGGEPATRFIVIGDEVWLAEGADSAFTSVPAEFASTMLLAFDPGLMLRAYANIDWASSALDAGVEDKNGVPARHLRIDASSPIGVASEMPAGSAVDVWVAEAGYLVAWEMSGFPDAESISVQVTGVNDPANVVERPS